MTGQPYYSRKKREFFRGSSFLLFSIFIMYMDYYNRLKDYCARLNGLFVNDQGCPS